MHRKVLSYEGPQRGDLEETKKLLSLVSKIEEQEIIERYKDEPELKEDQDINILQYFLFTKRKNALNEVVLLVQEWQRTVKIEKNFEARDCQLYTIGSYALGVLDIDSDIDCVLVAPEEFSRDTDFFTNFVKLLQENESVSDILPLPDTYVPIVKFKYNSFSFDIQFANYEDCADFGIFQHFLSKDLDRGSLLAINSIRNLEAIKNLVCYPKFQNVLRMVKLWARKRGIYSNIYGYLGGISWAILVAQTCISFPNFEINRLFHMFFNLFDVWKWPEPVILTSIDIPEVEDINLDLNVWNPNLNYDDAEHIMPIITPYYPQFNTSVKVIPATLSIIKKEFHRACGFLKSKEESLDTKISQLYEPYDITDDFSLFLRLDMISSKEDIHRWSGIIQNKLRVLLLSLQNIKNLSFRLIPQVYRTDDTSETLVIGMKYKKPKDKPELKESTDNGNVQDAPPVEESKHQTQNGVLAQKTGNFKLDLSVPILGSGEKNLKEDSIPLSVEFDHKCTLSETLDIKEEVKSFIECVQGHRSLLCGDTIKIKLVKDLDDLAA
ncbi:unnamed protein product [Moneuplotes crassus]|uniref:polynucleotide adenylyltransferase n=1 Tax=Euplotes crassus TaxID=5936 RepID=A0AAD1UDI3_EUPCR|nr:unnamed protein product [Moneuplotes crassus]